ncbi:MAG TPA: peptidase S8 [Pseudonocardiaceae bacterium]|nr:peptidase S8 [Pseudonocardiaceae bacterium]
MAGSVVAAASIAYASPHTSTDASPAIQHNSAAAAATPTSERNCDATPATGYAACDSWRRMDVHSTAEHMHARPGATPAGFGPSDLQSAYNLASAAKSAGAGTTVGIVDAFNDPNALSDLNTYRTQFGIAAVTSCAPGAVKSSTTPCFAKSSQTGATSYPATNAGWAEEESLDIDMVSAVCPNCNILLVEATSSALTDLGAAVNEAVTLGAKYVSNSYGGGESSAEASEATQFYKHTGVVLTASSGDGGFGVEFPAAAGSVVAVGGTSLTKSGSTRGWSETAWSGAGSGCSAVIAKPTWQKDTGCARRTVADVSAVADPNTGVAVFDSTASGGMSGWMEFGGTSVASPIIASVYALAGNAASANSAATLYADTGDLNDVTSGSNGSCGGTYLCTAKAGYDGPTGLGTPDGTGAF